MESPVCTPMASKFSIEQMMMQFPCDPAPLPSRTLSKPITDSSSSTSLVGRHEPARHDRFELLAVIAMPPPEPPIVNEGRCGRIAGIADDFERVLEAAAIDDRGVSSPISRIALAEQLAIFGHVDGRARGGNQLNLVFVEHALADSGPRAV